MPFADYLRAAVLEPLGLGARYDGRRLGALRLARRPARVRRASCSRRRSSRRRRSPRRRPSSSPASSACCPGFGRQEPNDWGLGFELRDAKSPHWTGSRNSPRTFGHFGRSGTFLWVDPDAGVALGCLTDLDFGDWAKTAWPALSRRGARGARERSVCERAVTGSWKPVHCSARRVGSSTAQAPTATTAIRTRRAGRPPTDAPGISQLAPDLSGLARHGDAPIAERSSQTAMRSARRRSRSPPRRSAARGAEARGRRRLPAAARAGLPRRHGRPRARRRRSGCVCRARPAAAATRSRSICVAPRPHG